MQSPASLVSHTDEQHGASACPVPRESRYSLAPAAATAPTPEKEFDWNSSLFSSIFLIFAKFVFKTD